MGWSMPDALFVFTQKSLFFLAGNRKSTNHTLEPPILILCLSLVQILEALKENPDCEVSLHFYNKTNQGNAESLKAIKDALMTELGSDSIKAYLLSSHILTHSSLLLWLKNLTSRSVLLPKRSRPG